MSIDPTSLVKPAAEFVRRAPPPARAGATVFEWLILAGFCACFFFFGAGRVGLVGADEPRYAQIAREMLARHDWVTPTLYGRPWLEKPILYYWQAMASYSLFGVSDWAARLPSAFDASAMVAGIFLFFRRYFSVSLGVALDAALITASGALVLGFAHAASTDMPLAASFSLGMLAWAGWQHSRSGKNSDTAFPERYWLLGFYFLMALGTLAKGPIAPLLAGLIIVTFAAIRRDKELIFGTLWWPGIVLFLAVAAPWYILVQLRTGNFFYEFLFQHNLERFGTSVFGHRQPFWYFLPVMLVALVPWTVPAVAGFIESIRGQARLSSQPEDSAGPSVLGTQAPRVGTGDLELFLALWGVLPIIFFSFSSSKLPGYILPAVPPFAMLAALWLRSRSVRTGTIPHALLLVHALLAGATLSLVLLSPYLLLRLHPPGETVTIAIIAGGVALGSILAVVRRLGTRALRLVTLLPVMVSLVFLLRVAAPVVTQRFSAREVAREVLRLEPSPVPVAVVQVDRELEYGLGFYLNRPIKRYERSETPAGDHVLISRSPQMGKPVQAPGGKRKFVLLGKFPGQQLWLYWVTDK